MSYKNAWAIVLIAVFALSLQNCFAENSAIFLRSVIVSVSDDQAEELWQSTNPAEQFKGQNISEASMLELAGVYALLSMRPLSDIMQEYSNFSPDLGDENGPWLVKMPQPIVERFASLSKSDFDEISKRWNEFRQAPENARIAESASLSKIGAEELKAYLRLTQQVCAESLGSREAVYLWVNIEVGN